jgi:hypothetical protein
MLTHVQALSRRCFLKSFTQLPASLLLLLNQKRSPNNLLPCPLPKFNLGERVKSFYESEDASEVCSVAGVVVGMVHNPDHWRKPGWVYWVQIKEDLCSPWSLGTQEDIHESDLQLW